MNYKNPRGSANILNSGEFKRVIQMASTGKYGLRDQLLLYMSFGTGLRAVELAALKIMDVINEDGTVIETVKLWRTKNKKSRDMYLTDKRIKNLLLEYIKWRKEFARKKRLAYSMHAPLFLSQKGSHFSNNTLVRLFGHLYKKVGIKATSHSGRRTFATHLSEQGFDIRAIQLLMGHKNINHTAIYIQGNPERLKRITSKALY